MTSEIAWERGALGRVPFRRDAALFLFSSLFLKWGRGVQGDGASASEKLLLGGRTLKGDTPLDLRSRRGCTPLDTPKRCEVIL